ncbi:fimbria/pilus outer membrane usher protein [Acinetobacter rudis]|uniref:Fimbria/pilus outer membrane usher protein n=1 Tax=Acinetobacter rudis TaxID=632955 RepID=A0AAW8JBQ8_9GAMM|nr:fimbria/pilus outer membrane usher protein [Acinetobacter rudis]MDQ8936392.1 fimbria/pilus outer membrane usher protein [Acinetobacter rudis]MDQ9018657.1 fimbria/pilus outer membrane usher protein [Acinetobacter rudis]
MGKLKSSFKIKLLTHCCLQMGWFAATFPLCLVGTNIYAASSYAEFDQSMLFGAAEGIKLSDYAYGNPIHEGRYLLNIYVNGLWVGRKELEFKALDANQNVDHCFELEQLTQLGVNLKKVKPQSQCQILSSWMDNASAQFNFNEMRYDITIPQFYMKHNVRGFVSPELWDRGINAGFLSYNFNTLQTRYDHESTDSQYLTLNAGINLAGWQLRHNAVATKQNGIGTEYNSINSYAQRAFPGLNAVLTIGESYTSGELFDSFAFTGVQLRSDDRMLPETQMGYAPVIHGVAQTQAMVEIRQNNQLIYQLSVAPGAFVIDDLYPTGYGGELQVTVREANGQIQRFNVPYASVSKMLRPGSTRFALTTGQVRDKNLKQQDYFVQGGYQRGINNFVTAYTGTLLSEHYRALQLGSAFSTSLGAISFDVTHADTDLPNSEKKSSQGQSYKLGYSKFWRPSNTNLSLATYHYSTSGYYNFQDAINTQDNLRRGLSIDRQKRYKNQYEITLNQNLPKAWGSMYLIGSWRDYWGQSQTQSDFQLGYSNSYKQLNYSISAQKVWDEQGNKDNHYFLTLSLPLEVKKRNLNLSHTTSDYGNNSSISGSFDRDNIFGYGLTASDLGYHHRAISANVQYRSPYATAAVSASRGQEYNQWGATLTGAVVAHADGVSFSPDMVDTMVLVKADQATGSAVNNSTGLKIDYRGYAVIPNVTPYRLNEISIDPKAALSKVELLSNRIELAPYAGAISRVEFKTKTGFPLLIKAKRSSGESLPFAANVYDTKNQLVGVVSQASQIMLRTDQPSNTLYVKWGDAEEHQCQVSYVLTAESLKKEGYQFVEGQCQ